MKLVATALLCLLCVHALVAEEAVEQRVIEAFYRVYPCMEPAEAIKIAKSEPKTIVALFRSARPERDRYAAFHVYVRGRLPDFKSIIVAGLSDRSALISNLAAYELPNALPKQQLTERYIALLSDKSAMLRYVAAEMLERYPVKNAVGPLSKLLADPEIEVRHRAAHTLAALRAGRPILRKQLASDDPTVAGVAATTLAGFRNEQIELSALHRYLRQQLPKMTGPPYNGVDAITYAIDQLRQRGDLSSLEVLELATQHEHQSVRDYATRAIKDIAARVAQTSDRTTR